MHDLALVILCGDFIPVHIQRLDDFAGGLRRIDAGDQLIPFLDAEGFKNIGFIIGKGVGVDIFKDIIERLFCRWGDGGALHSCPESIVQSVLAGMIHLAVIDECLHIGIRACRRISHRIGCRLKGLLLGGIAARADGKI